MTEEWRQVSGFCAQPAADLSRAAGRRLLPDPRELAVRFEYLSTQGPLRLPKTVYLLLCAQTASSPAAGVASPAAKTALAAKRQHKESKTQGPREPLSSPCCLLEAWCFCPQGTPCAFFSLDSELLLSPEYLCPSFPEDLHSPLPPPPHSTTLFQSLPLATALIPLWDAGWGALLVCAPTGFSVPASKSAWRLSDLHPTPLSRELESEAEPGQKLDLETGLLWSHLAPPGRQCTKPPVSGLSC